MQEIRSHPRKLDQSFNLFCQHFRTKLGTLKKDDFSVSEPAIENKNGKIHKCGIRVTTYWQQDA